MHFQPLRRGEIRLLEILPRSATGGNDENQAVHANVMHVTLGEAPPFEALSYCWGSLTRDFQIHLPGGIHEITSSLGAALRDLEQETSRLIWADALCINQDDLTERRSQVAMMREIYQTATIVVVYLGEAWDDFDLAAKTLEAAASAPDHHFEPSLSPHWSVDHGHEEHNIGSLRLQRSLLRFLECPWWSRVWTAQEYILAQRVLFTCGRATIEGRTVRRAYVNLRTHWRSCCRVSRALESDPVVGQRVVEAFFRMNATETGRDCLGGHRHEDYVAHPLEYVKRGDRQTDNEQQTSGVRLSSPPRLSFLEVLDEFRTKNCSDPRDKIYGLAGLYFSDRTASYFSPDYTSQVEELYTHVAHRMISESGRLDVISRAREYCDPSLVLPSFIPDWSIGLALIENDMHVLFYAVMYDACDGRSADWTVLDSGTAARTKAFLVDSIAGVGKTYKPGEPIADLFRSWARIASLSFGDAADKETENGGDIFDRATPFWRTICGNVAQQQQTIIGSQEYAGEDTRISRSIVIDLAEPEQREQVESTAYDAFLRWYAYETGQSGVLRDDASADFEANFRYMTHRRTFAVTRAGRIAMVPDTAQEGDAVAVLPGGRTPFILRSGSQGVYEVLGGAYVHGIMMGEAVKDVSVLEETVILR